MPVFLNVRRQQITRFGIHTLVERTVAKAAYITPSLRGKQVTPHTIRHYLPFLTMSSNAKNFADKPGNYRSRRPSLGSRTRHSFLRLKTVEKVQ
jgi:hypothetical protein